MANTKISALTSGNPAQSGDILPIDRAGSNFSVTAGSIASLAASVGPILSDGSNFLLANSSIVNIDGVQILANGENDIYTAPLGKRVLIDVCTSNFSGSSITVTPQVKISSTYFSVGIPVVVANNVSNSTTFNSQSNVMILEPGETFSLSCSAAGLGLAGRFTVYDATVGLLTPKLTSFASGDNTLYTVPAGKVAMAFSPGNALSGRMALLNNTGTTRTYKWNAVKNGGSPSTSNQMSTGASVSVLTGAVSVVQNGCDWALSAGGFVNINTDASTAGQFAMFLMVAEFPA